MKGIINRENNEAEIVIGPESVLAELILAISWIKQFLGEDVNISFPHYQRAGTAGVWFRSGGKSVFLQVVEMVETFHLEKNQEEINFS